MDPIISSDTRTDAFRSLNQDLKDFTDFRTFPAEDEGHLKSQILGYVRKFETAFILDNTYPTEHCERRYLAAIGDAVSVSVNGGSNAFRDLINFCDEHPGDWKFGFLTYDLKNDIEKLSSNNPDRNKFPLLYFFVPEILISVDSGKLHIRSRGKNEIEIFREITGEVTANRTISNDVNIEHFTAAPDKIEYVDTVRELLNEIKQGNIYEINFCRNYSGKADIDPYLTFENINMHSPAPFSTFIKVNSQYLISASPERFLQKSGQRITSQPMKGTTARSSDDDEDERLRRKLEVDEKERAENVMIVDLVRNDLSKSARRGSVRVDELFGIYKFPHVHQMISSISCMLRDQIHYIDAIRNCFPMGSMTGAPKLRSMELIERHEQFRRGLFSGSAGFITPSGNFDLNVVIRSILYNATDEIVSIPTGSAITAKSDPSAEWEECELKARALLQCLRSSN